MYSHCQENPSRLQIWSGSAFMLVIEMTLQVLLMEKGLWAEGALAIPDWWIGVLLAGLLMRFYILLLCKDLITILAFHMGLLIMGLQMAVQVYLL